jgi:hypothetical protein
MGSDAMIYIQSFMKIGSGISMLKGGYTDTPTAMWFHKPTLIFFKIREMWKKIRSLDSSVGTGTAQAVSRWLPTAAARGSHPG